MKKEKILEFILELLYVCLGCYGILFSIIDAFEFSYHKNMLYAGAGIFCVVCMLILYLVPKYKLFTAFLTVIAGELVLLFMRKARVGKGIKVIVDLVRAKVNWYMKNGKMTSVNVTINQTEGLLFFFIIIAAILIYGIVCCKKAWCTAIVMGIGMVLPFLVGEVPKAVPFICMVIVIFGAVFSKMGSAGEINFSKAGMIGLIAGVLATAVGVFVLQKPLKVVLNKDQSIEKKIDIFWEGTSKKLFTGSKGTGGVNNGELGEIDEFEEDDTTHLKVHVDVKPTERIYLQAYTGVTYTGNKWKKEGLSLGKPQEPTSNNKQEITVENIKANPKYEYRPYELGNVTEDEDYEKFAKKQYTDVPGNIQNAFGNIVEDNIRSGDVDSVINEVAELLDERTDYSLSPGKTPAGKDFAEYFYFENQKGYCSHYATVATLMFRMKEIPARYVSGYVVEPYDFKEKAGGGYIAYVTGDSAHAWAEVYKAGKGWVPAETTPGYSEYLSTDRTDVQEGSDVVLPIEVDKEQADEEQPQTNQMDTNKPDQEKTDAEKAKKPDDKSEDGKNGILGTAESGKSRNRVWIYAGLMLVVAGSVSVLILRRQIRRKRKMRKKRQSYNEKIQKTFHKIFEKLLAQKLIAEDIALDSTFAEKLCEACENISKEDAGQLLDIVYRANFGGKELERSDYQFCRRILLILEKMK